MDFSNIKNLIFDLGAVIINLDFELTYSGFAKAGGITTDEIRIRLQNSDFWNKHETGHVSDEDLRNGIRKMLHTDIPDKEIDHIWNALLLDIPMERINLLQQLSKKYRLFLLSNTNAIHIEKVNEILQQTASVQNLDALFEKAWYSHQMGLRKPNPDIYKMVLSTHSLVPSETVFIDDNLENIISAGNLGIQTIHVKPPQTIIELLSKA